MVVGELATGAFHNTKRIYSSRKMLYATFAISSSLFLRDMLRGRNGRRDIHVDASRREDESGRIAVT